MLGINSNINSLVAQQNLNGSQNALSQAITRLSSGKRINSAADDAAGLAIATRMQTQINGLNQGVSNANDGVSMIQTASSGLSQITSSLQRIRQLAVQASSGSLSSSDQQALQTEVTQQIAEVNRIASQTNYNGKNLLDGSAGNVSFQVGANVGQTIGLNLTQSLSAASIGKGLVSSGSTLGTLNNLNIDSATGGVYNAATSTGYQVTSINVLADGKGGFTFTDQNNQALSNTAVTALFGNTTQGTGTALQLTPQGALASGAVTASQTAAANAANNLANQISGANINASTATLAGQTVASGALGQITGLNLNADGTANVSGNPAAITSIQIYGDGAGGYVFGINGSDATIAANQLSSAAQAALFTVNATTGANGGQSLDIVAGSPLATGSGFAQTGSNSINSEVSSINTTNVPTTVANIDISTAAGANLAMESIDNALATVNNMQANLGAAQNRFTAISTTQQAQSTNLSQAQSQIQDANFAQETANLSKAQVLQQAGISVLAQANSLPQQVLKLLQ
ncbi:flagellin N-terminal helical domain-containing protein [Burkholderia multivorans]|uniref:Flagellin n=1 Tax=Burkholderia multivorans (strain ATCC 17616 / 249) TaxID=395019 RepID=A0A0H3KID1_BURM1|nr:flagellin [Burkholderia multivorans]ABX13846.1 flagellin domain protein [Burkholderia multivorans ATCC 17616]PRF63289.1 flagellin [Burkholderia multivorans]RSB73467.1 flagellin [Burkholderia multivorans]BAG44988.1 flagellin [Burkholderia multivorans ATCC 17616]